MTETYLRCPATGCGTPYPNDGNALFEHLFHDHSCSELARRLENLATDRPYTLDGECQNCGRPAFSGIDPLCTNCEKGDHT